MNRSFRRVIAAGTVTFMLAAMPLSTNAAVEKFRDVPVKSWYYTAVDYAVGAGLFDGTSPTTFTPKGSFTRGMIVKVLGDMDGIDTSEYPGSRFADVKPDSWYAPYVEWAVENSIADGTASRFEPNREVTREQMAIIFYNYAEYVGCDVSTRGGLLGQFSDGDKVSKDARYAMMWALTHGVLNGSGNKLDPQGTATRAQVAQILYNCRELFQSKADKPIVPAETPAPDTNIPRIPVSDAVRAQLKPNQDPEKVLDYVLNGKHNDPTFTFGGTTAIWDTSIINSSGVGRKYMGSWGDIEDEKRSSAAIANGFQMMLTRTASDRFCITAEESEGCFCLYYHPAEPEDSEKLRQIKQLISLPNGVRYDRSLCYEGAGWAGPLSCEQYLGAQGVADMIEYYLTDMHKAIQYYITEPEPGKFYN